MGFYCSIIYDNRQLHRMMFCHSNVAILFNGCGFALLQSMGYPHHNSFKCHHMTLNGDRAHAPHKINRSALALLAMFMLVTLAVPLWVREGRETLCLYFLTSWASRGLNT